jgi:hypothetical protein
MKVYSALLVSSLLLAGCAGPNIESTIRSADESLATEAKSSPSASSRERDHAAILKLAGPTEVEFKFVETVALKQGYKLHKPHESGAQELIVVVSDEPNRVEMQHLLLAGDHVVKHWREVWSYEPKQVREFVGFRTWTMRTLSEAERKGAWAQEVFEVSDEPRYTAIGRWDHSRGAPLWESNQSWRPLPRREYTERSDYDVVLTDYRIQLTPTGFVHEQDTLKLDLPESGPGEGEVLVRETGLCPYDTVAAADLEACQKYWDKTGAYWADVRAVWDEVLAKHPTITLRDKVDDQPMFSPLFKLASDAKLQPAERRAKIRSVIEAYVVSK